MVITVKFQPKCANCADFLCCSHESLFQNLEQKMYLKHRNPPKAFRFRWHGASCDCCCTMWPSSESDATHTVLWVWTEQVPPHLVFALLWFCPSLFTLDVWILEVPVLVPFRLLVPRLVVFSLEGERLMTQVSPRVPEGRRHEVHIVVLV